MTPCTGEITIEVRRHHARPDVVLQVGEKSASSLCVYRENKGYELRHAMMSSRIVRRSTKSINWSTTSSSEEIHTPKHTDTDGASRESLGNNRRPSLIGTTTALCDSRTCSVTSKLMGNANEEVDRNASSNLCRDVLSAIQG